MDSRHTTASFDYLKCQCFAASAPRAEMSCVVQSHMRTAAACSAFSPYSACICHSKLLWHPSGHLLLNSPRIERCPVCGAGTVLGSRDPRARDAPLPPVRRWQTPGRGAVGQRHGRAVRRRLFHGDPLRRDADRGDKGSVAFKDHIWGGGEASWMRGSHPMPRTGGAQHNQPAIWVLSEAPSGAGASCQVFDISNASTSRAMLMMPAQCSNVVWPQSVKTLPGARAG